MSHTKRSFVQACILRALPALEKLDACIHYAENVWERLTERGYGPPDPQGPRQSIDWYGRLVGQDKEWFDRFWAAYGYKQDRNGAAMRWHQLGDLAEPEAERIIQAAGAANRQWRDSAQAGQARKMAQGWLFEKRWNDFDPAPAAGRPKAAATDDELRELKNTLATLRNLHKQAPSDDLQRQIDETVKKIGNFRRTPS